MNRLGVEQRSGPLAHRFGSQAASSGVDPARVSLNHGTAVTSDGR